MNILEHIVGFLAPYACVSCRQEGALLCKECLDAIPRYRAGCGHCGAILTGQLCAGGRQWPALERVWVATAYTGVARQLVHTIKYERAMTAADVMARAMAAVIDARGLTAVTYAPTAYVRARQRGYDQAQRIARSLAQELRLPYMSLLARRHSLRQVGQSRSARAVQSALAYRPLSHRGAAGQHVLVVDDVLTTGSTLNAAAAALRQSGAVSVRAAVFAAA